MKRNLFQNVAAIPYKSNDAINREGFLSAVIGANVTPGTKVTVTVTHSDDGTTYEAVTDKLVFPDTHTIGGVLEFTPPAVTTGGVSDEAAAAQLLVGIDIDLAGLKNFVKFSVTGTDAALAVVLGDSAAQPV